MTDNALKRKGLAEAAIAHARREVPDIVVRFMNGVPHTDVPLHLSAADAVILTSTHEGWPNIIKEALACNVPFVATDISDLAAIARDAASCHVAPDRPDALGKALVATLGAPRDPDLRRHVAFMEMGRTVRAIGALYEAVLARPR